MASILETRYGIKPAKQLRAVRDTEKPSRLDEILSERQDTPKRGIPAVWGGSNGKHPRWQTSDTKSGSCYRVLPDGTRVPFKPERAERAARTRKTIERNTARLDRSEVARLTTPNQHNYTEQ
jgi:hypothetical protein